MISKGFDIENVWCDMAGWFCFIRIIWRKSPNLSSRNCIYVFVRSVYEYMYYCKCSQRRKIKWHPLVGLLSLLLYIPLVYLLFPSSRVAFSASLPLSLYCSLSHSLFSFLSLTGSIYFSFVLSFSCHLKCLPIPFFQIHIVSFKHNT